MYTVTYHRITQDDRAKAWLDGIRRKNMPPLENSCVCSDQFMPSCFEIDLRANLTGEKSRRDLKDDAIPSLFSYKTGPKRKSRGYQVNIAFSDEGIEMLVLLSLLLFYYESNKFAHLHVDVCTRFEQKWFHGDKFQCTSVQF